MSTPTEACPPVRVVRDASEAGRVVADLLIRAALDAVAMRGVFLLAIPGGSSPRSVFKELAQPSRQRIFPWSKTHLLWVDERAVTIDHPDSNFGTFSRELLPALPFDPDHIHRMRGELGPDDGALDYRNTLIATLGEPMDGGGALDVVLLGIGEDGHVASLFPRSPSLAAQDCVIGIKDSPKPPPERITLTIPTFHAARQLVLLGLGEAKGAAVGRSLAGELLPARLATSGTNSLWILDEAAARQSGCSTLPSRD